MLGRVGLVAIVASLDIGLSQWSFQYIDVALYTITKSTSIVFIMIWAILLRLEKKHWSLVIIVFMISSGLAMFTYKSTDFVLIGFLMVLSASFLSGIRWTLSQLIMQRAQYDLGNPLDMIYHVQPLMVLALLPFAVAIEGSRVAASVSLARYAALTDLFRTLSLIGVGGVIAFGMEVAEFLLVSYTSSLTLSVAGIVKEIISLTIAIIFQSSDISAINVVGLVVCMSGIGLHVVRKARKPEVEAAGRPAREVRSPGSGEALLSQSDSDSSMEVYHTSRQVLQILFDQDLNVSALTTAPAAPAGRTRGAMIQCS
jgi:solute carrier family 35 protein C2